MREPIYRTLRRRRCCSSVGRTNGARSHSMKKLPPPCRRQKSSSSTMPGTSLPSSDRGRWLTPFWPGSTATSEMNMSEGRGPLRAPANGAPRRSFRVKLLDHLVAMRQHRALINRALVGQFSRIERGRIIHQDDAGKPSRTAAGGLVECAEQRGESRPRALARENLGGAHAVAQLSEFAAGGEIGNDERRRVVAVVTRNDDVGHIGRAMGDEF